MSQILREMWGRCESLDGSNTILKSSAAQQDVQQWWNVAHLAAQNQVGGREMFLNFTMGMRPARWGCEVGREEVPSAPPASRPKGPR